MLSLGEVLGVTGNRADVRVWLATGGVIDVELPAVNANLLTVGASVVVAFTGEGEDSGIVLGAIDGSAAAAALVHTHGGGDITSAVASATDADTVDGEHASAFADASHSHGGGDITSALTVPSSPTINFLGVANGETQPTWKSASSAGAADAHLLATDASGYTQLAKLTIDTNGTSVSLSTYKGANSDGYNLWIGNGGASSIGAPGEGYKGAFNGSFGFEALYSNTTGSASIAVGPFALYANTTGDNNSALGVSALTANISGMSNSALGYAALYNNTTANNNNALGSYSLFSITTGSSNSALGWAAGRYIADGSSPNQTSGDSIYVGAATKALADGDTNEIVIGYGAIGAGSNTATLGNTSITSTILRGTVQAPILVVNNAQATTGDFRVASAGESNMFWVDANGATDGLVYIGGSTNGLKVAKGGIVSLIGSAIRSPTSSGSGAAGEICWDANYIYICTASNTWKRAALTGGY